MMRGLALLVLLTTLYPIGAAEVPGQVSLTVAELGANVTFQCPVSEKERNDLFFWYKQRLGCTIQTVATGTFTKQILSPQFNNSRFRVTAGETSLTIMNISKEDEATYFCLVGTVYSQRFGDGTFLAVKDGGLQKSFYVKQSPEAESVLPGDSVTLQCSLVSRDKDDGVQCPHGRSVFWFRSGSGGSHPGIIYTQDTQPGNTSCVYRLSKRIQNSSDAGTYHCAVASCGEILFGGGTRVDTNLKLVVIVLGVLLACCVTVIVLLIFYVNQNRVKEATSVACNPAQTQWTADQSANQDGDGEVSNYAALNLSTRQVNRVKKREPSQDCVYSAVRVNHNTQLHL
ncbi:uncharacterized protein LOC119210053 [Pungitius pungitius]|uniref:uncharacterized protein LOC119210053 n=1 Tax=Pungitius pungitius TaxID=134920 RepID=UPI002E1532EE